MSAHKFPILVGAAAIAFGAANAASAGRQDAAAVSPAFAAHVKDVARAIQSGERAHEDGRIRVAKEGGGGTDYKKYSKQVRTRQRSST